MDLEEMIRIQKEDGEFFQKHADSCILGCAICFI